MAMLTRRERRALAADEVDAALTRRERRALAAEAAAADVPLTRREKRALAAEAAAAILSRRQKVALAAEGARAALGPAADNARVRLGTATDQALATLTTTVIPALVDARDKLSPYAELAMEQGRTRGREAAIRWGMLEPPPPPQKSHWLRNLLIAVGLGGAGAAAYKVIGDRNSSSGWTSGDEAAAPSSPVSVGSSNDSGGDSVPWGDTPAEMPGMDPSAVDPVVAEPAGSDPLATEVPASTAGPIDGSDTAPTAPLASEETVESPVATTPDQPLQQRDVT